MALTPKQARFVQEYLIDLNATEAAKRCGYSVRTAYSIGHENLTKPDIADAVQKAMDERAQKTGITAERVLAELGKIGFSDLRKAIIWKANVTELVEEDGGDPRLAITNEVQLIDSASLDDDTAAAISEISQTAQGGVKIRFHDKRAALESIGRHLGMFKDRVEHTGADGGPIQAEYTDRDRAKAIAAVLAKGRQGSS